MFIIEADGKQWQALPLDADDREAYEAFVENECRMAHNPLVEFGAKIAALPERLQEVAVAEFVKRPELFTTFPQSLMLQVVARLPAVDFLAALATGRRIATEENYRELYPQLRALLRGELEEVLELEELPDSIPPASQATAAVTSTDTTQADAMQPIAPAQFNATAAANGFPPWGSI